MHPAVAPARSFWTVDDVDVDELADLIDHPVSPASYPNAALVDDGVVVYDMPDPNGGADRAALLTEIATALDSGPGIVVLRRAVERTVLSRATDAFEAIIEVERRSDSGAGDHFAAPGANDRVWNALEKLAVADPGVFVDYYATEAIELAATAWLGPHYQVTSQINVVNPSGGAQSPHRDYHLGFMTDDQAARFPARAHLMSAGLTLQGAVAHVDMPVASGPT
ncbi:MAG: phytanoyl-CoA dioxygenase family protein, partial [Actinomycetota bacterium]